MADLSTFWCWTVDTHEAGELMIVLGSDDQPIAMGGFNEENVRQQEPVVLEAVPSDLQSTVRLVRFNRVEDVLTFGGDSNDGN